jgi:tetratricopeptide (TPR) repeat protein
MGGGAEPSLALRDTTAESGASADPAAVRSLEDFRKKIAPAVADSYNNLGDIAAVNKNYSTAASYFQSAAEWNPSLEGLDLNWGRAAFTASQFSDAIAPLTRYLHQHPDDRNIRAVLGISQFMTQDYRGCLTTLHPVESDLESIPQIAFVYADSLVKTGQTGPGIERLVTLEKQNPEVPDVHRALGEAYAGGSEKQQAIDEFRIAIRLEPGNPQAHRELGDALLAEGDAKGAIPELESAIQLAPGDPDSHRELARAYRTDARPADAAREMQTYNSLRLQSAPGASAAPLSEKPSPSPKPD